jgi:serine/threonine protein kinase
LDQGAHLETVALAYCTQNHLAFRRKVGEGAFKETFEVADSAGQAVALKLYKAGASSKRSDREVDAMRKCEHPNIARLVKVGTFRHQNEDFVVTIEEFLAGGTLTDRGQIDVQTCRAIGTQLIEAITHISAAGLVHRDLKPDNIMFRADRKTPVVVDFGVVRNLSDTSLTPSWAPRGPGTPFFAAPEQLNNEKHHIDWRTDQFSLGVVLAVAVTGKHPFQLPGIEPYYVVDRVAARQSASPEFSLTTNQLGLSALERMVKPWAVERYRTPALLREAWECQ